MRKLTLIFAFIASIFLFTQCNKTNKTKIGVIVPLTGAVATYGQDLKKGIDIAFENETDFEVLYEDDKAKATVGITAMKKLHDFDNVNHFIGCATTTVSVAIAEEAQKQNSLLLVPIATGNHIKDVGDNIFMISPRNEKQAIAAFDYANKQGKKKIGVLYQQNAYGNELSHKFISEMKAKGMRPIFKESFQDAKTQARTILSKVKELEPDMIFIPSEYEPVAIILRQAKELGIKTQFVGTDGAYSQKLIELARDAAEGFCLTMFPLDKKSEFYTNFRDKYFKKYNAEPNVFTCYGYETASTMIQTLKHSKDCEMDKKYLLQNHFLSFNGKIGFDENGEVKKTYSIMTVNNHKFE